MLLEAILRTATGQRRNLTSKSPRTHASASWPHAGYIEFTTVSNLLQRSGRDDERFWCAAQVAQAVVKRTPWTWAITAARAWHSLGDPLQVVCCLEVKPPK